MGRHRQTTITVDKRWGHTLTHLHTHIHTHNPHNPLPKDRQNDRRTERQTDSSIVVFQCMLDTQLLGTTAPLGQIVTRQNSVPDH